MDPTVCQDTSHPATSENEDEADPDAEIKALSLLIDEFAEVTANDAELAKVVGENDVDQMKLTHLLKRLLG